MKSSKEKDPLVIVLWMFNLFAFFWISQFLIGEYWSDVGLWFLENGLKNKSMGGPYG